MNPTKKQIFNKPFLNLDEQIEQLKSRGMKFHDINISKHYLSHLNYYRLGGYWLLFEDDHDSHTFKKDTFFEDVLNLYVFDRELRLLILDAIEVIEVSIRSKLAYHLSESFGSHVHLNKNAFYSEYKYNKTLDKLRSEIHRNKNEIFINHHLDKYEEELPPIWVCVEVMTMGQISNWYNNIKDRQHRQSIAKYYNLDEKILRSFLHHLTIVRNTAAHHSRVWNRKFTVDFTLANYPEELKNKFNPRSKRYIYNTFIMCNHMINIINKDNHWKIKIDDLINKHKINTKSMGYK